MRELLYLRGQIKAPMAKTVINFKQFVAKFPRVELPITISSDAHHLFSKNNDPLSQGLIKAFISELEPPPDEFTEYVPCFSLEPTKKYIAIVYWKASLLTYEYTLACFDLKGKFLEKKVIAGTKAKGELLATTVALIDEERKIFVVGGAVSSTDSKAYDPSNSQSIQLQLLDNGQIVSAN